MSNVTKIYPAVTHRACPDCGWMELQKQVDAMRFDMDCPRCGKHKISEFQPIRWDTPSAGGDHEQ